MPPGPIIIGPMGPIGGRMPAIHKEEYSYCNLIREKRRLRKKQYLVQVKLNYIISSFYAYKTY